MPGRFWRRRRQGDRVENRRLFSSGERERERESENRTAALKRGVCLLLTKELDVRALRIL